MTSTLRYCHLRPETLIIYINFKKTWSQILMDGTRRRHDHLSLCSTVEHIKRFIVGNPCINCHLRPGMAKSIITDLYPQNYFSYESNLHHILVKNVEPSVFTVILMDGTRRPDDISTIISPYDRIVPWNTKTFYSRKSATGVLTLCLFLGFCW